MTHCNELLEAAFDAVPEGVALVCAEGTVVLWNQAAQDITGFAAVDLLGRPLSDGLEALLQEETPVGDSPQARARGRWCGHATSSAMRSL